jgi:hypothetical protein
MDQTRANLIFILSLATAVLCIGTCAFFLHIIKDKNEHSSSVLWILADKIQEQSDTNVTQEKSAQVQAIDQAVDSHLVDPDKINTFVDYLEAFGTNTNTAVVVNDIRLAPKDKNSIQTAISIVGTFADVERTIALLENDTYQIHITAASFVENPPQPIAPAPRGKTLPPEPLTWHADVSFTVLSS